VLVNEFEQADSETQAQISDLINGVQNMNIRNLGVLAAFEIVGRLIHFVHEKHDDAANGKTICIG